jgi:protein phosphatase
LPAVRRIHDVIGLPDGRTFLLVESPPQQWHFAADPRDEPVTPELAIEYGLQIGRALAGLHRNGYALNDNSPDALERVVLDGHDAFLIDFLVCARLPEDETQKRKMVLADIGFLARLLYWLATSHHLPNSAQDLRGLARLPRALRVAITLGARGSYGSLPEMVSNLAGRNLPPLRLTSGKATHPGRVRDHNEDQFFVYEISKGRSDQPLPAFYMVADGLGGHEAGEVASDTISSSLKDWLDEFSNRKSGRATQKLGEQPDEALRTAILNANAAVFHQAQARRNNMGATVTAALIIGEQAFVANVGDSRTYRLRRGELHAITADHSLVYSLYKAQQITLDDIYTHPQRNQIYRSLGEKPQVEVDIFIETLEPGDILLLCSDGLWEMVRDPQLRDLIRTARNPQDAADRLIEAANRGGGEDNITAIVVKVE